MSMTFKRATGPSLIDYIYRHARPFRMAVLVMLCTAIVDALATPLTALLIKRLINVVKDESSQDFKSLWQKLRLYVIAFIVVEAVLEVMWRLYGYVFDYKMLPRLRVNILSNNLGNLLRKGYGFYQTNYAGHLGDSLVKLARTVPDILRFFQSVVSMVCMVIINVVLLASVSFTFAFLMMGWIIVFLVLVYVGARPITKRAKVLSAKEAYAYGKVVDALTNILSIKLFMRRRAEEAEVGKSFEETAKAQQKVTYTYLSIFSVLAVFYLMLQIGSILLLVYARSEQRVTLGDFGLVFSLNNATVTMFWFKIRSFLTIPSVIGESQQALEVIEGSDRESNDEDRGRLLVTRGSVSYQDVTFQYPEKERPIFDKLSFTIAAGQRVGVVGYSGSGKSTLIKLLLCLYEVQGGKILLDGQSTADVTKYSLRKAIGLVPQNAVLFHRSVGDNIRCGKQDATDDEVMAAAKRAYAHEFIMRMKDGYGTVVGEGGASLSGGQRQRIALARVILKNPPIIIFDEATSQLDSVTERYIQASMDEIIEGKTTIVIAHRLSTLQKMDRIVVMEKGLIIEDGTHAELLAQKGRYHELWHTQVNGFLLDGEDGA